MIEVGESPWELEGKTEMEVWGDSGRVQVI